MKLLLSVFCFNYNYACHRVSKNPIPLRIHDIVCCLCYTNTTDRSYLYLVVKSFKQCCIRYAFPSQASQLRISSVRLLCYQFRDTGMLFFFRFIAAFIYFRSIPLFPCEILFYLISSFEVRRYNCLFTCH